MAEGGSFVGLPALILSDVVGTILCDLARNKTEAEEGVLENQLVAAIKGSYEYEAEHRDAKLDNISSATVANDGCPSRVQAGAG